MIRISRILALLAMLVTLNTHAQEATVNDIQCLAHNIFYEAGSEPEEGKVAVGIVTLNRTASPEYPGSICGVVKQRTALSVPKTQVIQHKTLFSTTSETQVTWTSIVVCQFSWNCTRVKHPKPDDPRWIESQRIAQELLDGGYELFREKYANAMHFHAKYVRPGWRLKRVATVGGHIFYE